MTQRQQNDTPHPNESTEIQIEAADWLIRLQDNDPDPEEPYQNLLERHGAFVDWLARSPTHVQAFLEILEIERRARNIDRQHTIEVQALLANGRPQSAPAAKQLCAAQKPTTA
jgi:ferric-dicitrate binding protein FerR (iron transport regulator)